MEAFSRKYCGLCNRKLKENSTVLDLQQSCTIYTNTKLKDFLEICVDVPCFSLPSNSICENCFTLVNELDSIQLRSTAIQNQLKDYVIKQSLKGGGSILPNGSNRFPNVKDIQMKKSEGKTIDDRNLIEIITTDDNKKNTTDSYTIKNDESTVSNQCGRCLKHCITESELNDHLAQCKTRKCFVCEICGQSYKQSSSFKVHLRMHNGEQPFQCAHCKKVFTQKIGLLRHQLLHTGEHPYQCDLCGKQFIHRTSFSVHQASHTGYKAYNCIICGLAVATRSHLKRHMRVHTGEKKFACQICGKPFAERYNLNVHEKLHLAKKGKLSIAKESSVIK